MHTNMRPGRGLFGSLRFFWGLVPCLVLLLLPGCALLHRNAPEVVDNGEYARLVRTFPKLMAEHGLAETDLTYVDAGAPDDRFGDALFKRLSPSFLNGEKSHDVYLGHTFRETLTPSSRVYPDRDGQGFAIVHPSQKLSMRMLAVVDWNPEDNHRDWLSLCTVETFKGNRVRRYYVLSPEPAPGSVEPVEGAVMAVVTDRGPASPILETRDMSGYGVDDSIPPTVVEDHAPGEAPVTAPPSKEEPQGGVVERDI